MQVRLLAGLWRQISAEEKLACEASAAQDRNRCHFPSEPDTLQRVDNGRVMPVE